MWIISRGKASWRWEGSMMLVPIPTLIIIIERMLPITATIRRRFGELMTVCMAMTVSTTMLVGEPTEPTGRRAAWLRIAAYVRTV